MFTSKRRQAVTSLVECCIIVFCVIWRKPKPTDLGGEWWLGCKSVIVHMLIPFLCSLDSHSFNEATYRQMPILYVRLALIHQ